MEKHTKTFKALAHYYQGINKGNYDTSLYGYMVSLIGIISDYDNNCHLAVDKDELRIIQHLNSKIMNNPNLNQKIKNRFSGIKNKFAQLVNTVNTTVVVGHENEEPIIPSCD